MSQTSSIVPSLLARISALEAELALAKSAASDREGSVAEASAGVVGMQEKVDSLMATLARTRNDFLSERAKNDELLKENSILREINAELRNAVAGRSAASIIKSPVGATQNLKIPSTSGLAGNPFISMADLLPTSVKPGNFSATKINQPFSATLVETWLKTDAIISRMSLSLAAVLTLENPEFSGTISESPEVKLGFQGSRKIPCDFKVTVIAKRKLIDVKVIPEPGSNLFLAANEANPPMLQGDTLSFTGSINFTHPFEHPPVVCVTGLDAETKQPIQHYAPLPLLYAAFFTPPKKLDTTAVLRIWESGFQSAVVVEKTKIGCMNILESVGGAFVAVEGFESSANSKIFYGISPGTLKGAVARIELGTDVRIFGKVRIAVKSEDSAFAAKCVARSFAAIVSE